MDYKSVVLRLLNKRTYPKLKDHVVMDIYFKMIPVDYPSSSIEPFDSRYDNPEDVFSQCSKPFVFHFMACVGNEAYYLHRVDALDAAALDALPMQCTTIKLNRSFLDDEIFREKHDTFEEEIYRFLTLLNFDVPRVARVLNMGFFASTRFLPQRIQLWVFKYTVEDVLYTPLSVEERRRFGPEEAEGEEGKGTLPVRVISGRLSECRSRSTLLSLNDDLECPRSRFLYTHHFSTQWKTVIPLAYNPLENPIIV